jgi:protoporphyrin/coproporphyrin ferrochelatase
MWPIWSGWCAMLDVTAPPAISGRMASGPRVAVVLFNLGGPDRPEAVAPFLRNLFTDPAILRVPFFVRPVLARIIARARVKPALANYALLDGRSPLLPETEAQVRALEAALPELNVRCFIAMRYWHPFSDAAAAAVRAWKPDEVVLLPLYPQYSTTTTGSSLTAWREAAARAGLVAPTTTLCCYHSDPGFAAATASLVGAAYDRARAELDAAIPLRVLFSAHGLPEVIVKAGDPYQFQVERTVASVLKAMANRPPGRGQVDWSICYQSRATPQVWLGPSAEQAIECAAHDKVAVLVVPIAFVSEHSETLVELDVEYRTLAEKLGVAGYYRVPTQSADPGFIAALARLVRHARANGPGLCSFIGGRTCPRPHTDCPHARAGVAPEPADEGGADGEREAAPAAV